MPDDGSSGAFLQGSEPTTDDWLAMMDAGGPGPSVEPGAAVPPRGIGTATPMPEGEDARAGDGI